MQNETSAISYKIENVSIGCDCWFQEYTSIVSSLSLCFQGNTPPVVVNTDTLDGSPYVRIMFNLPFIVLLC